MTPLSDQKEFEEWLRRASVNDLKDHKDIYEWYVESLKDQHKKHAEAYKKEEEQIIEQMERARLINEQLKVSHVVDENISYEMAGDR